MANQRDSDQQTAMGLNKIVLQIVVAVLVIAGVLGGLALLSDGFAHLLRTEGEDLAIPGDEVHELDIQSTRQVIIQWERVLQIGAGLGVMGATLFAAQWINRRYGLTPPDVPDHRRSVSGSA